MDAPGTTTTWHGVSVKVNKEDPLNVRLQLFGLEGAKIIEFAIKNESTPAESTTFPLPQAFLASAPLDYGAMPNDPENLKDIITDLDFKLASCQQVAATEFQRLSGQYNSANNELQQTRAARSNDRNREKRTHGKRMKNLGDENRALRELFKQQLPDFPVDTMIPRVSCEGNQRAASGTQDVSDIQMN